MLLVVKREEGIKSNGQLGGVWVKGGEYGHLRSCGALAATMSLRELHDQMV